MTLEKICEIINLPQEVTKEVLTYAEKNKSVLDEELQKRLANRDSWDDAVRELQERIGKDTYGFVFINSFTSGKRLSFNRRKSPISRCPNNETVKIFITPPLFSYYKHKKLQSDIYSIHHH